MQIRNRLSLYFTLVSSYLLMMVLGGVYIVWARAGREDFYRRLQDRAALAAAVCLEADEMTGPALQKLKQRLANGLPEEVIRVYDPAGNPRFLRDSPRVWPLSVVQKVHRKKLFEEREGTAQTVGITYRDNQGEFVILASAHDVHGYERRISLLEIIVAVFGVQILIQFIAGRWFAKRVLQPVDEVNRQVQSITATDLHLRVDEGNGRDELGLLAKNFNGLLARLEEAFEVQKLFIANASHELRTPLTSLMGALEMGLSKARTGEEYQQLLQSALQEATTLRGIIQDFLLLSQAENNLMLRGAEQELVRMDEILWELQEAYARKTPALRLLLALKDLPEDAADLCVGGSRQLLYLAVDNLVRNGFKFSQNQPVTVALRTGPRGLLLSVSDKGIGIPPEELPGIFQPFFRGAKAREYDGHGLGLYMAASIFRQHKGAVTVNSTPGKGTTFNVVFLRTGGF